MSILVFLPGNILGKDLALQNPVSLGWVRLASYITDLISGLFLSVSLGVVSWDHGELGWVWARKP